MPQSLATIAEGVRAQQAITDHAALLDLAHDAIFIHDDQGRITYWNRGAERSYGYLRADAMGQVAHELLRTEFPVPRSEIEDVLASSGYWEGELTHYTCDGRALTEETLWAHSEIDGHLRGTLEICRDVTARKAAEAELARRAVELKALNDALRRTNARLERSNLDLEQFAYAASHDLSEPLRAISGPISLVARRYEGQLGADADEYIAFAVDGCERMQKVIDGLLAYSRVGRNDADDKLSVDTQSLFDAARIALGPAIGEAGATVTADSLPVVSGSPTQLGQVFQNLIANAVKFGSPGVAPKVHLHAERRDEEWRFTVSDNGIGIDEQHRARVFGMFKRLHSRDQYEGTGIGLALCQRIVERHGGQIGIESIPDGQGTRLWFTLPATLATAAVLSG